MTRHAAAAVAVALIGAACSLPWQQKSGEAPPLHRAVEAGNVVEVRRLLDAGAAVDARDPGEDLTALGWSAAKGSVEIAELLMARGANVNARSSAGFTPLHNAAWFDRTAMATLLLSKGADVSARTREASETPLHRALERYGALLPSPRMVVAEADLEAMGATTRVLVEAGSDVGAKLPGGETPLHLAALTGYRPVVELLLARGATVDARGTDGVTPLYEAVVAGRLGAAEALLARGATVDARTRSGYTPLAYAARSGAPALAGLLLSTGADVNARDVEGRTPLLQALWTASLASPAGEQLLVKQGASAEARADLRRRLQSVEGKWRDVTLVLLGRGADPNAHPAGAASPLILAAVAGDPVLVDALLARGAAIDDLGDGETALHAAVAERHGAIALRLLEKGASVTLVNQSRRTPLHFAAYYMDDPALIDAMVARGAAVNARDAHDHTPLWYANDAGHPRAAEALRSFGAN